MSSKKPAPLVVRARAACPETLPEDVDTMLTPLQPPDWAANQRLWTCQNPRALFNHTLFQGGAFYVQDPSTLLAPSFVKISPGSLVGDFCAAPGGKTLLLAERLPPDACLLATDRSWKRMDKLERNLSSVPSDNIQVFAADATALPLPEKSMDAVLLDVPCSNTGVIRRRPDARWRFSNPALADVARLQRRILDHVATRIKPGGQLVYSTCSIEPAENARQIEAFLTDNPDWSLAKDRQLFPSEHWDGAYAAALIRNA